MHFTTSGHHSHCQFINNQNPPIQITWSCSRLWISLETNDFVHNFYGKPNKANWLRQKQRATHFICYQQVISLFTITKNGKATANDVIIRFYIDIFHIQMYLHKFTARKINKKENIPFQNPNAPRLECIPSIKSSKFLLIWFLRKTKKNTKIENGGKRTIRTWNMNGF